MKKYFNKNLIISEKEEEQFQSSNIFGFMKDSLMITMKKLKIIVT